jgi:hypothetical protein
MNTVVTSLAAFQPTHSNAFQSPLSTEVLPVLHVHLQRTGLERTGIRGILAGGGPAGRTR